jgi:hypothetical protein
LQCPQAPPTAQTPTTPSPNRSLSVTIVLLEFKLEISSFPVVPIGLLLDRAFNISRFKKKQETKKKKIRTKQQQNHQH